MTSIGYAQNLLNDGSFEEYRRCPQSITMSSGRSNLLKWNMPTGGTPDYYHTCADKFSSTIPRNKTGYQKLRTGNGYVGISTSRHFSEYLQTEFNESLRKDSLYYIEFWVSRAEISGQASRKLGVYLSASEVKNKGSSVIEDCPQIYSNAFINDTTNWVKVSGTYTANGNERFLIVGGFGTDKKDYQKIKYNKRLPFKRVARYYIDDVCLKQISKEEDCHCEEPPVLTEDHTSKEISFSKEKAITLPDFTFKSNQWELEEKENPLLDSLAAYLEKNKQHRLSIEGHTDNVGKETDNYELSTKRAETIKDYLMQKGIVGERIQTKGLGSKKPITSNKTEEGRSKNRRVEIRIEDN